MQKAIERLQAAQQETMAILQHFPEAEREKVFFGNWSLKDIVGHLSAWSEHQMTVIEDLKAGKIPQIIHNTTDYNNASFEKHKSMPYQAVYDEYVHHSRELIKSYQSLPAVLWGQRIWPDKNYTPKSYIKIETYHFKQEHLPALLPYLSDTFKESLSLTMRS